MSAPAHSYKRRLLLASDNHDKSRELERILQSVSEVHTVSTSELPDVPADQISGVVVDINLRSSESVQRVRNQLQQESYRAMPPASCNASAPPSLTVMASTRPIKARP